MYTRPPIGSCAAAALIFCPISDPCSSAALMVLLGARSMEVCARQGEATKSKQTNGEGIRKLLSLGGPDVLA